MNENLEKKLMKKFPWFEAKNIWSGEKLNSPYYCECDDGWYNLIYNCCKDIEQLYKSKNADINTLRILQIKEKYGTLRIYLDNYIDGTDDIVTKYENLSSEICEVCGDKGSLKLKNSWMKTLCEKH